uniref:Uncharacterized protein n=1 Tax=Candidatus Kentrum sp. LFY TaxID=2126342 RepID=A0A450V6Y7_9GAMM|nr:MAG: hypothetical protein BECKLFY1418A_GA0070994_111814 [Candidatus Kentron sp. LFY]
MHIAILLETMTTTDKLQVIEEIWTDLVRLGKGEACATPSPLPRGGQFPPFTDVPVSGIGRLCPEFPLRGVDCFDLRRLRIKIP